MEKKSIHFYAIKGVIGFPVWGYGFFHIHDLRSFYLSLINHLKKNHFAVDLIFIDDDLEKLQREILPVRHNVIVWYEPLPEFKQMMQVSQEQGVRNLILSKEKKNSGYRDYQLDWKEALKKALTHWLKTGIKYVTIPVMQESTDLVGGVLHSGKQGDLQFQKYYCPDEKALKELTLRLQGNKDHGVYFENDMDLHLLSRRHGQALCDLFAVTRVLISHSFDAHPAHYVPGHKADVAEMDWDKAAHSIALDIIRHQLSPRSPARIYRAVFKNDIPLNTLASEN
ncbi:hypothetical protein QPK87_11260 [Kamptonema cortianum]|nr:hypothetical protein [Kamptonema cortianum]